MQTTTIDLSKKLTNYTPTPEEILQLVALARNATTSWELLTTNGRTDTPPRVGFRSADGFSAVVATFPPRTWAGSQMVENDAEYVAAAYPTLILGLCERLRQLELQLHAEHAKKLVFPDAMSWEEKDYLGECIKACIESGIPFSVENQSTPQEDR